MVLKIKQGEKMLINIEDAPFTEEEIKEILAMGFTSADWGHPGIQLDNPVAFFKKRLASVDDMVIPLEEGEENKTLRWKDEGSLPFGLSK